MEEKVKQIISDLFSVEKNEINPKFGTTDCDEWDSFGHLNLITALEEEFDILIDENQISDMQNFELIMLIIKETIKNK